MLISCRVLRQNRTKRNAVERVAFLTVSGASSKQSAGLPTESVGFGMGMNADRWGWETGN